MFLSKSVPPHASPFTDQLVATPANPEWPSPWPEGDQLEKAPGSGRASAALARGAHVRDLGQAWLLHSCHEVQHWIFLLPTTSEHLSRGFWGYCTAGDYLPLLPRSTQTSTDPNFRNPYYILLYKFSAAMINHMSISECHQSSWLFWFVLAPGFGDIGATPWYLHKASLGLQLCWYVLVCDERWSNHFLLQRVI